MAEDKLYAIKCILNHPKFDMEFKCGARGILSAMIKREYKAGSKHVLKLWDEIQAKRSKLCRRFPFVLVRHSISKSIFK